MPRHELLNNVAHKDLRVITRFGAEFGDNVGSVMVFPTEFEEIQREYPIFFRKDATTGEYQSIALLGFQKGENLFLDGHRWIASYIPAMLVRGPFMIGFQERETNGETRKEPVLHIDLDNKRVSQTEGEPIFLPTGGNTPYLNHMTKVLRAVHDGITISKVMFNVYNELELIEPLKMEVKVAEGEGYSFDGLYTISREKLLALDPEKLHRLHKSGLLEGAYLILASMNNVKRLMAFKQRRLQTQQAANTP